jgi:energy-coupling factor transporter ATP-binding protein EcfA2
MQFQAKKATKTQLKARLAIDGPSGSGKTYTALVAATALAGESGRIVVIDTERGSAKLYADKFNFDVVELPVDHRGFSPVVYVEAIKAMEEAGYDVIVIDSLSHAWEGEGGALEQVDQAAAKIKGNSYAAWRSVTPMHNRLVDSQLQSQAHIVATMRSKMDYIQEEKGGSKTIRKVGMAPIQRAGMEYEYTMVIDMDVDHKAIVSKSRCDTLADLVVTKPDAKFFQMFVDWLNDGVQAPAYVPATAKPEVEIVPGTQTPTSDINPDHTFPNLLKYAKKKYGADEDAVKQALKDGGFKTYSPKDHIAARAVIDQTFQKVEPEVEPDYLAEPAE